MESTSTNCNGNMFRMKNTIEVQKTMIDKLQSKMNDMKVNFETEKVFTARKMADLSDQNEVITGKLKSLEAESSGYKVQMMQFEELKNKVHELKAEKDSYDRLRKDMMELVNGLKAAPQHANDRPVQTSGALDPACARNGDCEEFADVNRSVRSSDSCDEETSVGSPVKANPTAPAKSEVQASPSASGMTAKVPEELGTSEGAVLMQVKQPIVEPSVEMPVESGPQEAGHHPDDASEEVRLPSANGGPIMTAGEVTSSDVAFRRLLSSTNPRIRELQKMDVDAIRGFGTEFCIDFLYQIAIEEGLQLCYKTYIPKSGHDVLAGHYTYVQLSISPIGTVTLGFGESVVEAQTETAFNCLLFFKHNMM